MIKGTFQRYPLTLTTAAGAICLAAVLAVIVQAQQEEKGGRPEAGKPSAEREKPAPEKPAADEPRPSRDRFNPHADRPAPGPLPLGEPVAFVGIAAVPVPEALRAHLELPEHTGVAVGEVFPESPAAEAGLRAHDVLTRLDDQILVTPEQFQVLVRMRKPGEKVTLTWVRAGKEHSAAVTLGSHRFPAAADRPLPPRDFHALPAPGPAPGDTQAWNEHWRQFEREWTDRMQDWWNEHGEEMSERLRKSLDEAFDGAADLGPRFEKWLDDLQLEPGAGARMHSFRSFDQRVTVTDDEHSITVTTRDGRKYVTALDREGKEVFEGYCETDEERSKVPPDVLKKVDRIQIDVRTRGLEPRRPGVERERREGGDSPERKDEPSEPSRRPLPVEKDPV